MREVVSNYCKMLVKATIHFSFSDFDLHSSSPSAFPSYILGFTILGEIFSYVSIFLIQP